MRAHLHLDQRGSVAVAAALILPVIAGFTALAVDGSSWIAAQRSMQGTADMAAYSAVIAYGASTNITTEAKAVAAANGYIDGQNGVTVTVAQPPTSGHYTSQASAIEVTISQPQPMFFANMFLSRSPTVRARAVAVPGSSNACVIALDAGNPPNVTGIVGAGTGGLNVSGGGTVNLVKCDVFVNAMNSHSIDVTGGGTFQADNVTADGGVSGSVVANQTLTTNHSPATQDPYATTRSIPTWSTAGCDTATSVSGSIANPTGLKVYCAGITVSASATFAPGVYIINNGGMTSAKPISGTGVTFILTSKTPSTDTGVFTMKSGATLTLSAPTTGSTRGITLWADASLPHKADNFMAGSISNITGAVYLPSHMVNYSGSGSAGSNCFQMVSAEISVSGAANFTHLNCSGVAISSPPGAGNALTE